jgi:undecaprenyl-diphosphatase
MNIFDATILHWLNGFAQRSLWLDVFVGWLTVDGFQKGGVIMMLFWWAWFIPDNQSEDRRQTLISTVLAVPFSFVLSRLIGILVPFRMRPIFVADLHLRTAYSFSPQPLFHWNAFPSDHAALFFTIITGLFLASRRLGVIALVYGLLFVCMPRVYLGLHYPTDIVFGALLGIAIACLASVRKVKQRISEPLLSWLNVHPGSFYACLFFYTWQVAAAFGWIRNALETFWHVATNS